MAADRVTTFKIFVGNVPQGTSGDEIRQIFEEFGNVVECDCVELLNKAFVHMEDDIEGKHAIDQLQGRELKGNVLIIEESQKKRHDLPRTPTVTLLVKNISANVDARGLRNMFKRFGFVIEAVVENGEGHVKIEATGDIGSAIKDMNGFVVDEQAITVEPAPITSDGHGPSPNKREKFKTPQKNSRPRNDNWANAYKFNDYMEPESYAEDNDYGFGFGHVGPSPWEMNEPGPMHPPPERILRDPHARTRGRGGNFQPRFAGPPAFRGSGPPFGGGRGFDSRMFPPPQNMRFGMPPRGRPGPMRIARNSRDLPFQHIANPFEAPGLYQPQQQQQEVFYEDEPIVAVPRSRANMNMKMNFSGANSIPLGGGPDPSSDFRDLVPRNPFGSARRGGGRSRGRGRGGWSKPPKFTAMTHEVAPGEKYPVPPMNNPGFRAPLKWARDEVKKKVKRVKKPLEPAELPDYQLPVPDLPKPTIPQGAVLTAFPPPAANFSNNTESNNGANSHVDFTSDDF